MQMIYDQEHGFLHKQLSYTDMEKPDQLIPPLWTLCLESTAVISTPANLDTHLEGLWPCCTYIYLGFNSRSKSCGDNYLNKSLQLMV